ncbi:RNA pseudouridine synthase [Lujinxingia sediminis]|uniref:RNA pseudouridine synthase n=1 Tax=Lujinxingia sediminis TaxID=2480984 RepID=A0ABY0CTZ8_9DELT|nr:RNA pseudouridine synthase [Lujinxingia sediminis]RVU45802.1 RNA pseudouridine synthase [Lujinxingia sediminis]
MNDPMLLSHDGDLFVINKPAGWVVHPTNDPAMKDLVSWLNTLTGTSENAPIHRLDRETSGVVLMSPSPELRAELGEWFAQNQVRKEYRALVYGSPPNTMTLDAPLFDRRRGRPLNARTRIETLERFVSCSYLRVQPETGRKHQIRQHLQREGHAIVGESRYKPKKFLRVPGFPGRLWLHALRLELPDDRVIEAPLAPELDAQLTLLRSLTEDPR